MPDLGGAMENYGCVTWSDAFVYRSTPSPGERELRAVVLLHEMAHMWFGDMVTMRWWDDLWLNEAFAEWACYWAAAAATEHRQRGASFLAGRKLTGYAADRAPSRHPIAPAGPRRRGGRRRLRHDHLQQGRERAQAARRLGR